MVKKRDEIIEINESKIRRHHNQETGVNYYSIVDIVAILTESTNPRNYWKVLKNRLNNTQKELVTECNQLKMQSSDGKSYLTDVANSETILKIVEIISPLNVPIFKDWFIKIENSFSTDYNSERPQTEENSEIGELQIDGYEVGNNIYIRAFIAGVSKENISISFTVSELTIRGVRKQNNEFKNLDCLSQELYWGTFARTILLPEEIEVNGVEATNSHGLLEIILPKKNKSLRKKIETKFI